MKLTSLSSLYKDPEDAWRWIHISGKLHQQLEYKQPGVTPQHDQLEACKTTFHFSPATQHITNEKHYNPTPKFDQSNLEETSPIIYKFINGKAEIPSSKQNYGKNTLDMCSARISSRNKTFLESRQDIFHLITII